jgi:hypothetical protein
MGKEKTEHNTCGLWEKKKEPCGLWEKKKHRTGNVEERMLRELWEHFSVPLPLFHVQVRLLIVQICIVRQ